MSAAPDPLAELIERTRNGATMARQAAEINWQMATAYAAPGSVFAAISLDLQRDYAAALQEQADSCAALAEAVRGLIAAQESN